MRARAFVALLAVVLPLPAFAAPADDVKAAMLKLAHAHAYHVTIAGGAGGGGMEMDFVRPDRIHMTNGAMEMIRVGATMWVKVNGSWMQIPMQGGAMGARGGPAAASASVSQAQALADHPEEIATVTDRGPKLVDGETLHVYDVQQSGSSGTLTIFVGADGFPHAMETVDKQGKVSHMRFSRFDDPAIAITPPA
ncbi:MAG TPA: hypothetical protein VFB22_14295 [Candidatus Baltobacteraceae bacterium]|nr:hypothetical protein [Candidatus Baltobacteraceae bacterium]